MNLSNIAVVNKREIAPAKKILPPDTNFTIPQVFAANVDWFFNKEAFEKAGIDVMGFARQADSGLLAQNLNNNITAMVKRLAAAKRPLPDQAAIDNLVASYTFLGTRGATSEEGMTTEQRTILSEIRKTLRARLNSGLLANYKQDGEVVFSIVRVQTRPEAEGTYKDAPKDEEGNPQPLLQKDNLSFEDFEAFVTAAYEGEDFDLVDAEGRVVSVYFSAEPVFKDGKPASWSAIVQDARNEAARQLARRRAIAAEPEAFDLTVKV
jgi:hypothetical protein